MPRRLYTYPSSAELDLLNLISTIGAVILTAGVLVLLINLIASVVAGQPAPADPWGGDSLEWATGSPVPGYGFHHIRLVSSAHPLWDQEYLDKGSEKTTGLVNRLAEWPNTWRPVLATSARNAEPEAVYRVAGPSAWPFVAAIGLALVLISLLFDQILFLAVLLLGLIVLIVALMGWHRRTPDENSVEQAELDEFAQAYGVPIYTRGSPAFKRWAVILLILGILVVLAVGLFSYLFYLTVA